MEEEPSEQMLIQQTFPRDTPTNKMTWDSNLRIKLQYQGHLEVLKV